jgi:hypothetical protein
MKKYAGLIILLVIAVAAFFLWKSKPGTGDGESGGSGFKSGDTRALTLASGINNFEIRIGSGVKETVSPYRSVNFFNLKSPPAVNLDFQGGPIDIVGESYNIDVADVARNNLIGVALLNMTRIESGGKVRIRVHNDDYSLDYQSGDVIIPDPYSSGYQGWGWWCVYAPIYYNSKKNESLQAEAYWNDELKVAVPFSVAGVSEASVVSSSTSNWGWLAGAGALLALLAVLPENKLKG